MVDGDGKRLNVGRLAIDKWNFKLAPGIRAGSSSLQLSSTVVRRGPTAWECRYDTVKDYSITPHYGANIKAKRGFSPFTDDSTAGFVRLCKSFRPSKTKAVPFCKIRAAQPLTVLIFEE
jgi:hypothetical protein